MIPDRQLDGTGKHPRGRRRRGIVIEQTSVGGIPTVERVLRRLDRRGIRSQVYLSVRYAVERAGLIHHARDRVGKTRALHTVEHHRRHSDLSDVRLASRFAVHDARKQIEIGRRDRTAGTSGRAARRTRQRHAERCRRRRADYPVRRKSVAPLEIFHRTLRRRAEYPVGRAVVIPPALQLLLHLAHLVARAAAFQRARRRSRARRSPRRARQRHTERGRRRRTDYPVRRKPVNTLKIDHRAPRARTEYPVGRAVVISPALQLLLHLAHLIARAALLEHRRFRNAVRRKGGGRQQERKHEQERKRAENKSSLSDRLHVHLRR